MKPFSGDCLEGKRILITGGLGAIGRVVVSTLLRHSASVAVNDILNAGEAAEILEQSGWTGERCLYLKADVTLPGAAENIVGGTVEAFGGIDIALCHAGIVYSGPLLECKPGDWDRILDINLKGAFLVAQAAARAMVEAGTKGKIIFTSSWVQDVPWPGITPYTVTKSALKMLMRGMAREFASHGIRVNAIAPGIVAAGMAQRQWETEPDYRRRAERAIPLGCLQPPESVADALLFLCSEAADYMTGATLLVDGGCSLYPMD
jgi:NAD(P)-dependent dehydrogenase (short-subunit alcohol dehydrogenase family)